MNRIVLMVLASMVMMLGACASSPGPVTSEEASVERVLTGYQFTEGPASDGMGNILFTDIPNGQIIRYNIADDAATVFWEDSGGANGLMFDRQRRLVMAEGGSRRITRLAPETGEVVVLADSYEGGRLNSPNDVVVDAVGGVYFTDPRYGNRDSMEQGVEGVYYIATDGEITRVIDNLERPNGLILSNDGRTLYVADNTAKNIWAYHITRRDLLDNGRVFAWMDPNADGGGDGMTIDAQGNVYCAGQGMIWVWDSSGALIDQIPVPEQPSNCAFGGPRNQTLYITARTSLYRIPLGVRGGRWSGQRLTNQPAE